MDVEKCSNLSLDEFLFSLAEQYTIPPEVICKLEECMKKEFEKKLGTSEEHYKRKVIALERELNNLDGF